MRYWFNSDAKYEYFGINNYPPWTLAICMVCGDPAGSTQRLTASHDQIQVGATGMYEARCRLYFEPPAA